MSVPTGGVDGDGVPPRRSRRDAPGVIEPHVTCPLLTRLGCRTGERLELQASSVDAEQASAPGEGLGGVETRGPSRSSGVMVRPELWEVVAIAPARFKAVKVVHVVCSRRDQVNDSCHTGAMGQGVAE